uniref:Uncharacterized protein n=1 Tax=Odontella aurita TaxID=265563 RepID=A0A7S4HSL4_9STRA
MKSEEGYKVEVDRWSSEEARLRAEVERLDALLGDFVTPGSMIDAGGIRKKDETSTQSARARDTGNTECEEDNFNRCGVKSTISSSTGRPKDQTRVISNPVVPTGQIHCEAFVKRGSDGLKGQLFATNESNEGDDTIRSDGEESQICSKGKTRSNNNNHRGLKGIGEVDGDGTNNDNSTCIASSAEIADVQMQARYDPLVTLEQHHCKNAKESSIPDATCEHITSNESNKYGKEGKEWTSDVEKRAEMYVGETKLAISDGSQKEKDLAVFPCESDCKTELESPLLPGSGSSHSQPSTYQADSAPLPSKGNRTKLASHLDHASKDGTAHSINNEAGSDGSAYYSRTSETLDTFFDEEQEKEPSRSAKEDTDGRNGSSNQPKLTVVEENLEEPCGNVGNDEGIKGSTKGETAKDFATQEPAEVEGDSRKEHDDLAEFWANDESADRVDVANIKQESVLDSKRSSNLKLGEIYNGPDDEDATKRRQKSVKHPDQEEFDDIENAWSATERVDDTTPCLGSLVSDNDSESSQISDSDSSEAGATLSADSAMLRKRHQTESIPKMEQSPDKQNEPDYGLCCMQGHAEGLCAVTEESIITQARAALPPLFEKDSSSEEKQSRSESKVKHIIAACFLPECAKESMDNEDICTSKRNQQEGSLSGELQSDNSAGNDGGAVERRASSEGCLRDDAIPAREEPAKTSKVGAGNGTPASHAAGDWTDDEGKLSWLLAQAKADVAKATSTLSQSIMSQRTSSQAMNSSDHTRANSYWLDAETKETHAPQDQPDSNTEETHARQTIQARKISNAVYRSVQVALDL